MLLMFLVEFFIYFMGRVDLILVCIVVLFGVVVKRGFKIGVLMMLGWMELYWILFGVFLIVIVFVRRWIVFLLYV